MSSGSMAESSSQPQQRSGATLLMTHPGVGPVTALATDVFLGDPSRFPNGKALASYVGLIPSEYSSGARQRLGHLSKQGNPFLRFLWGEAVMGAVRRDAELQRFFRRKLPHKGLGKARVAAARSSGFACGSCCGIRSRKTSSVAGAHGDRHERRGPCGEAGMDMVLAVSDRHY